MPTKIREKFTYYKNEERRFGGFQPVFEITEEQFIRGSHSENITYVTKITLSEENIHFEETIKSSIVEIKDQKLPKNLAFSLKQFEKIIDFYKENKNKHE